MKSASAALTKLLMCFLEGLFSFLWEHRQNICLHLVSVKNGRRLLFFPFSFAGLIYLWVTVCVEWFICFREKWKLLSNAPVGCRFTSLKCGAKAFQSNHILVKMKVIQQRRFWVLQWQWNKTAKPKPGGCKCHLQCVGCHRLILYDL